MVPKNLVSHRKKRNFLGFNLRYVKNTFEEKQKNLHEIWKNYFKLKQDSKSQSKELRQKLIKDYKLNFPFVFKNYFSEQKRKVKKSRGAKQEVGAKVHFELTSKYQFNTDSDRYLTFHKKGNKDYRIVIYNTSVFESNRDALLLSIKHEFLPNLREFRQSRNRNNVSHWAKQLPSGFRANYNIQQRTLQLPLTDNKKKVKDRFVQFFPTLGKMELRSRSLTHVNNGDFLRMMAAKRTIILDRGKSPQDLDRYIGIEIECLIPQEKYYDIKIECVEKGLGSYLQIKEDMSIKNKGDEALTGKEFCLLVKYNELFPKLNALLEILNKYKSTTNETCGLHVHIDRRQLNHDEFVDMFNKLQSNVMFLKNIVHPTRINNRFCVLKQNLLKKDGGGESENESNPRYWAINKNSNHPTIEVRLHHSTLDFKEIINWITVLLKIVQSPVQEKRITSLRKKFEFLKFNEELANFYVNQRKRFYPQEESEAA